MAREWLLRGVDPEELKKTSYEEIPQTPRSKWENFWYHHKLKFWLAVFAVVVLVVGIVQVANRNDPDYMVLLMTEEIYTQEQVARLEAALTPYGEDLDGDGAVEIRVQNCLYGPNVDQTKNSGIQQVQAHLMAGDRMLFVWEPDAYTFFKKTVIAQSDLEMDFLTTLTGESGLVEGGKIWKYVHQLEGFSATQQKEGLCFGVRETDGSAEKSKELQQQCLKLLEKMISGNAAE